MSRPAGMWGVPLGETAVCHAGVIFTQPQSNWTVPPMFGFTTFSTPLPSISAASSTMARTVAPVRLAMSTVSPRWSPWPWVRRIASAGSSSALAAAFGLPDRKGSTSTSAPPPDRWNAEWPSHRTSAAMSGLLLVHELVGELVAHRHADEHAHARLLGEQRAHGLQALLDVGRAGRLEHLLLVRGVEPVRLVEGLVEDALERGRVVGHDPLGVLEPGRIGQRLHGGFDLGIGVGAAGGHWAAIIRARDGSPDLPVAWRRVRLQALGGGPAADRRGAPAAHRPARAGRRRHRGRRGRRGADRLAGHRPDGRLLHADRRRPVLVRPYRGDQRALGRLCDGRAARERLESGRVPARGAGPG